MFFWHFVCELMYLQCWIIDHLHTWLIYNFCRDRQCDLMASLFANQITFAILIWWLEGLKFTILFFFFPSIMIMFPFYVTQIFFFFFQLHKLVNLNVGWSNLNFRKSKLLEVFYFSKRLFPLNLGVSHETIHDTLRQYYE